MIPVQTTATHRVFIDSSILIAAAISARGAARDLLQHGFRGEVELCISSLVLEESERNLRLKAPEAMSDFGIFKDVLESLTNLTLPETLTQPHDHRLAAPTKKRPCAGRFHTNKTQELRLTSGSFSPTYFLIAEGSLR